MQERKKRDSPLSCVLACEAGGMLRLLAVLLALLPAAPADSRLQSVDSFAFGLGSGSLDGDVAARFRGFDLVVVDGEEASAKQVAALKAQGTVVLGYLSVGTIERGRFWFKDVKRYRLDLWDDFGEWYADTSKR